MLDALLVFIVFVLDLIFYLQEGDYSSSSGDATRNEGGQEAALLIIVLRLWRIHKVVASIVEDAQAKVLAMLMMCEKEKNHAEHKVDILILKVEDLEHEVAYLKEKAKKCERENSAAAANHQISLMYKKKSGAKRTPSNHSNSSGSASYCPCQRMGPLKYSTHQDDSDDDSIAPATTSTQSLSTFQPKTTKQQHNHTSFVSVYPVQPVVNTLVDEPCSLPPTLSTSKSLTNKVALMTNVDVHTFALQLARNITSDVVSILLNKTGTTKRKPLPRLLNNSPSSIIQMSSSEVVSEIKPQPARRLTTTLGTFRAETPPSTSHASHGTCLRNVQS